VSLKLNFNGTVNLDLGSVSAGPKNVIETHSLQISAKKKENCSRFAKMQNANKVQMHSISFSLIQSLSTFYFSGLSKSDRGTPANVRVCSQCTGASCAWADAACQDTEPRFQERRSERRQSQAASTRKPANRPFTQLCARVLYTGKNSNCAIADSTRGTR